MNWDDLTDAELQAVADRGKEAAAALQRRYGERLVGPVIARLEQEASRDRRQIYKKIKGSGMYAEWHTFQPADRIRIQELFDDELIEEYKDKRGKVKFRITEIPYPT